MRITTDPTASSTSVPDLSVVIPTYNSARTLRRCLESIRVQTSPASEVIVVDRFSQDTTTEIARSFNAFVIQTEANRSLARNIGIAKSSREGIVMIDSDMVLRSELFAELKIKLIDFEAIIIPEVSKGEGFWAECKAIEREFNRGDTIIEAPRCFRRSALAILGGYDPQLVAGEDWDLHSRARASNLAIGRVESSILHDEGKGTLVAILRKKYHYGKSIQLYVKSNPNTAIVQMDPVRRILAPGIRIMVSDKVHGIGLIVLKTSEFLAAGLGSLTTSLDLSDLGRNHSEPPR